MKLISCVALSCLLGLSAPHANASDISQQFNFLYQELLQAQQQRDIERALPLALRVYELGKQEFSNDLLSQAKLALLLGQNLVKAQRQRDAIPYLQQAVSKFSAVAGQDSPELIPSYIALGRAQQLRVHIDHWLSKAEEIAENNPLWLGDVQLAWGEILQQSDDGVDQAEAHFEQAYQLFAANPHHQQRQLTAAMALANWYYQQNQLEKAKWHYQHAEQLLSEQTSAELRFELHAALFAINDQLNQPTLAQRHCTELAKLKPMQPINTSTPVTNSTDIDNGEVTLSFTINAACRLDNIQIVRSTAGRLFEKASIEALKKWRHIPQYQQGKIAQSASSVTFTYSLR